MSMLRSVMNLCTQSASRKMKVRKAFQCDFINMSIYRQWLKLKSLLSSAGWCVFHLLWFIYNDSSSQSPQWAGRNLQAFGKLLIWSVVQGQKCKNSNFKNTSFHLFSSRQLSSVSKRVSAVDEDDPMDDDFDVTRTQQGDDFDLFEDGEEPHSSTNGVHTQKGANADTACGPGRNSFWWCVWCFWARFVLQWS